MPDKSAMHSIIDAVSMESLTYLDEPALVDLFEQVAAAEESGRRGILIEAGCALGGSAIIIAAAKSKARPLYVYDVFGMIPPPSEHDGPDVHERYGVIATGRSEGLGSDTYYGYVEDLYGRVTGNFRNHGLPVDVHNVHLVKGLFQDTLRVKRAGRLRPPRW